MNNSKIRLAANDVFVTVDRSVGSEGAPDGTLYEQALRVARLEADAVWDAPYGFLDLDRRSIEWRLDLARKGREPRPQAVCNVRRRRLAMRRRSRSEQPPHTP